MTFEAEGERAGDRRDGEQAPRRACGRRRDDRRLSGPPLAGCRSAMNGGERVEAGGDQRSAAQAERADQMVLGDERRNAGAEGVGRVQHAKGARRVPVREHAHAEREGHAHRGGRHRAAPRATARGASPPSRPGVLDQRREPARRPAPRARAGPQTSSVPVTATVASAAAKARAGRRTSLRPARGEQAAERHAEHERGQDQRARPDGVADHAAERPEPQHLEQQRRRAEAKNASGNLTDSLIPVLTCGVVSPEDFRMLPQRDGRLLAFQQRSLGNEPLRALHCPRADGARARHRRKPRARRPGADRAPPPGRKLGGARVDRAAPELRPRANTHIGDRHAARRPQRSGGTICCSVRLLSSSQRIGIRRSVSLREPIDLAQRRDRVGSDHGVEDRLHREIRPGHASEFRWPVRSNPAPTR